MAPLPTEQYPSDLDRILARDGFGDLLRLGAMWTLLIAGFCLVAFPSSIAFLFVTRPDGNGYGWSTKELESLAQTFRSIGFLLFGAGLVERVLIRFGK